MNDDGCPWWYGSATRSPPGSPPAVELDAASRARTQRHPAIAGREAAGRQAVAPAARRAHRLAVHPADDQLPEAAVGEEHLEGGERRPPARGVVGGGERGQPPSAALEVEDGHAVHEGHVCPGRSLERPAVGRVPAQPYGA